MGDAPVWGSDDAYATPRVLARRDSNQSIPNNAYTAIDFEFVDEESPGTMWDIAAPSKFVAPAAWVYVLSAAIQFVANATGDRYVAARVNGVDFLDSIPVGGDATASGSRGIADPVMLPGDYIEVMAFQNSGGALNAGAFSRWSPAASLLGIAKLPYTRRVILFGDSLSDSESTVNGYAGPLRTLQRTTHVLSRGVSGQTTTQMVAAARLLDLTNHPAAYAVILGGSNDALADVAAATIQANLTTLLGAVDGAASDPTAIIGTIPPFGNNAGYSAGRDAARQTVNTWIRGLSRPIADFDAALRDPAAPANLRAAYDSGDGLHPNAAGYAAMAGLVDALT